MEISAAVEADLPAMVEMIELRRREYESYQPVFWKKAEDSADKTLPFFRALLSHPNATVLAARDADRLLGFLIAMETPAPPVFAPGGMTATIDDFCVAEPALWPTVGRALLERLKEIGRDAGWCQLVVVCGKADQPKSAFLQSMNLSLASTWWTTTV